MILTTDVRGASTTGHYAEFPSSNKTVVVQIPLANNTVPAHTVLHNGACTAAEADGAKGGQAAATTATASAAAPTATDDGSDTVDVDDATDNSTADDSAADDSAADDSDVADSDSD